MMGRRTGPGVRLRRIAGIKIGKEEDNGHSAEKRLGDLLGEIRSPGLIGRGKGNLDMG
jgi:hypothetical protein